MASPGYYGLFPAVTCKKVFHIWISCRACRFFRNFWLSFCGPAATPTIRFPVAVDLGWASRDDIEGTSLRTFKGTVTLRGRGQELVE